MINKITFKNFKLFKQKQTLELRPITILIGKNNTGKSAILKLPVLISSCMEGMPINWKLSVGNDSNNFIELGSDFKDLVYNKNETGAIELGVFSDTNFIDVAINKQYGILEYKLNGVDIEIPPTINGFLIAGKPIENLSLNLDYLGAVRIEPESVYSYSAEKVEKIGVTGKNAYPLLIQDFIATEGLVNKVSDWYKLNFEGWDLKVLDSKTTTETNYEIAISNSNINAINIKQTGQGIHQVLPLIIRSFMNILEKTLIIIEEPETHLHPAAHGSLAERFVDSYLDDKNRNYLIETHSQNFVLRMRRLVAEGKINPDDLAIYYVDFDENESLLTEIKVDELGGVESWPIGIFGETSIETRAIYNAQLNDLKNVD